MVEKYFSRYLDSIHTHGSDVTETSGDGMMIDARRGPGNRRPLWSKVLCWVRSTAPGRDRPENQPGSGGGPLREKYRRASRDQCRERVGGGLRGMWPASEAARSNRTGSGVSNEGPGDLGRPGTLIAPDKVREELAKLPKKG